MAPQNGTPGRPISFTLQPEWLLPILTAGPYAVIGFVLLFMLIDNRDIPDNVAEVAKTHGSWVVVIMLLLWLIGWIVHHFRSRENELVDTLKSMSDRYDKTISDNTRVMAGILEYMRYRHDVDTGMKGRDVDAG